MAASDPFTILIDGLCPLCRHEGELLRRLDAGRGRLRVQDITDPAFDPASLGTSHEAVMGQIHAVAPDGSLVTGMEVFRRAYRAVGWGWLWAPTGWPVLKPLFDLAYRWFARNRGWLTGRDRIAARRAALAGGAAAACPDGRCRVD